MDRKTKLTDAFFAKAIADISAQNTLYFTPRQLLYFLDKRLKRKMSIAVPGNIGLYLFLSLWTTGFFGGFLSTAIGKVAFPIVIILFNLSCIYFLYRASNDVNSSQDSRRSGAMLLQVLGIFIAIAGILYGLSINSILAYWIAALIGLGSLWLGIGQKRRVSDLPERLLIGSTQIDDWLNAWSGANGSILHLLPSVSEFLPAQSTAQSTAQSEAEAIRSQEITAYSFDRLVVCQSDAIAQTLIANNYHFENNCAILSLSGYPQNIFDTTMQMLRRNPNLKIFALHDCCASGVAMVHQLRTSPQWFLDSFASSSNLTMIDVGLLPRQVMSANQDLFVQQSNAAARVAKGLSAEVKQGLTVAECEWLESGYFVELESFTPQRLIRILNYSLAKFQQMGATETGAVETSDSSFFLVLDGQESSDIYASDSFG